MLTFAFPLTPQVLAQGADDGAVGRQLQLDGGPSAGSDSRGQTGSRSEGTEPSASAKKNQAATEPSASANKSQAATEKTGETAIGGRSKAHTGWRVRPRHRFAMHRRRYHVFAFHMPRHRFVIHRRARRFVAVNESTGV
jgi:hypothetical protein